MSALRDAIKKAYEEAEMADQGVSAEFCVGQREKEACDAAFAATWKSVFDALDEQERSLALASISVEYGGRGNPNGDG